eukprot:scaffold2244_cov363-Pavlova_lutheri.AAC.18
MLGVCQNAVLDPNFDVVVNLTTAAHIWVHRTFCNRTLHGLGSLLRSRPFCSNLLLCPTNWFGLRMFARRECAYKIDIGKAIFKGKRL